MTLEQLLAECSATAYPEPESTLHSRLIPVAVDCLCAELVAGSTILDIGFGTGLSLQLFQEKGHLPTGVSVLESEVSAVEEKGFAAFCLDMHDIDRLEGAFDACFARHVLEHSPVPLLVLKKIHSLLNPGGLLYVETPAPATECHHERNPNHWSVFPAECWAELIKRAGFDVLKSGWTEFETLAGKDRYDQLLAQT